MVVDASQHPMPPSIGSALIAAGVSDDDVEKLWSGNILAILDAADRRAAA